MGFLIIRVEGSISERQLLFAKEVVSFLSIRFLEDHLTFEAEQRMFAAIWDEILFGRHSDETVISDRLKLLGFNPQKNHVIIRLAIRDEMGTGKISLERSQFDHWKAKFAEIFANASIFWKGTEIIVIASFPDRSQYCWEDSVKQSLSLLMEEDRSDLEIDLGYSLIVKNLCNLPECYEHAKKAISYGRAVNPEKHLYSYNDYLEIGLLSHSAGTSESIILKERILTPILEYDKKFNAQLWITLERSLMNSSLEAAAKGFFIHISTLRYRLEKIKLITGVDFFTPSGKFLLYLTYVLSKVDSQ
jgi:purine catabolism regulator